jgi:ankyrin repeat protein
MLLTRSRTGQTALHYAAGKGHLDLLSLLVEACQQHDAEAAAAASGAPAAAMPRSTPAGSAAGFPPGASPAALPRGSLTRRLVEAQDHVGQTALHRAAVLRQRSAAERLLLAAGADRLATIRDREGRTAWDLLVEEDGHSDSALLGLLRSD